MKICTICKINLPKDNFSACKTNKDGLQYRCKSCYNEYRTANRERILKQKREHYHKNSIEILAKQTEYYKRNKLSKKRYDKLRRVRLRDRILLQLSYNNLDKIKELNRAYRKTSKYKDGKKLSEYRRRLQKLGNTKGKSASIKELEHLKNSSDCCFYCKEPLRGAYHVDHVIPLAKGGGNEITNLVIACNLSKGAKDPFKWHLAKFGTPLIF